MKPIDSSEFHLPAFDDEVGNMCRARGSVHGTFEGSEYAPETSPGLGAAYVRTNLKALCSRASGLEVFVAIERVRNMVGEDASIGVVLIAPDRETYDSLSFPGQIEGRDEFGPFKRLDMGRWNIHLRYHSGRQGDLEEAPPAV